jgi:ABC-type multidrug transport system fused ATPase/permease subunit
MFYKAGLSLSFFLQHLELLSANSHIRTEVGQVLNELLILVRDVGLYYRTRISTLSSAEVSIDFSSVFSKNIFAFYRRKDHIIDALWECRLGDDCANVRVIRQWLDTHDNIARTVIREQLAANSRRHEHTCEWMGRPLLDFSRGTEDVLAITGPSGSGKSILAGWIVERLQKPLDKKMYETLSVTIGMLE